MRKTDREPVNKAFLAHARARVQVETMMDISPPVIPSLTINIFIKVSILFQHAHRRQRNGGLHVSMLFLSVTLQLTWLHFVLSSPISLEVVGEVRITVNLQMFLSKYY